MDLTPEQLGAGAVGAVVILGALGQYLRSLREKPKSPDPIITGIGVDLGSKEQTERLIKEVGRIADALADKKQSAIEDRIDDLAKIVEASLNERPQRRR